MSATVIVDSEPLNVILTDLSFWKKRVKDEWEAAVVVAGGETGHELVLLNHFGVPTAMPSYQSFKDTWDRSGYTNPFEFDWLGGYVDPGYVRLLDNVLNEQLHLWGSEAVTCLAFGHFHTFTDRIGWLVGYFNFMESKGRYFI
jgi:hypothetical protein